MQKRKKHRKDLPVAGCEKCDKGCISTKTGAFICECHSKHPAHQEYLKRKEQKKLNWKSALEYKIKD